MFLCLSSGTNPRYRQDVLRALAMPLGADLQFRYRRKWLSPKTISELGTIKTAKPRALISYIDQSDPNKEPGLVPCRFARIVDATQHGSTVSLILRLEGFAFAQDLSAANSDLRKLATDVPVFLTQKLVGYWWTDLAEAPGTIKESNDLGTWELIIDQLYGHSDFRSEELFYMVVGVASERGLVDAVDGRLAIQSGLDHEIQIYHYHPKTAPSKPTYFVVASTNPLIKFSTGTSAAVDSPYDLKRFRFRSDASLDDERTVVSVRSSATEQAEGTFGIDLLITVAGRKLRYAGFGLVIGLLLAIPPMIAAFANTGLDREWKWAVAIASLIAGIGAGEVAAFGLKKL